MNINAIKYFTINFISISFPPNGGHKHYTRKNKKQKILLKKKVNPAKEKFACSTNYPFGVQNSTINVYLASGKMVHKKNERTNLSFEHILCTINDFYLKFNRIHFTHFNGIYYCIRNGELDFVYIQRMRVNLILCM